VIDASDLQHEKQFGSRISTSLGIKNDCELGQPNTIPKGKAIRAQLAIGWSAFSSRASVVPEQIWLE
jgi:hypothetical protein